MPEGQGCRCQAACLGFHPKGGSGVVRAAVHIAPPQGEENGGDGDTNPFAWSCCGELFCWLAAQCVMYCALTILVDCGIVPRASAWAWQRFGGPQLMARLRGANRGWLQGPRHTRGGGDGDQGAYAELPGSPRQAAADQEHGVVQEAEEEDPDVLQERLFVQSGLLLGRRRGWKERGTRSVQSTISGDLLVDVCWTCWVRVPKK